jgi:hypothetical protein
MSITIGSSTITGLATGGLTDGIVNSTTLASGAVTAAKMAPGYILNSTFIDSHSSGTAVNSTSDVDVTSVTYTPVSTSSTIFVWVHANMWYGSTNSANGGDAYGKLQVMGGSYASRTEFYTNGRWAGNYTGSGSKYKHTHFNSYGQFTNSDTSTKTIYLVGWLALTQPTPVYFGSDSGGQLGFYIEEISR